MLKNFLAKDGAGQKSLRPRKSFAKDSKRETLYRLAKATLGRSKTFFQAVKLPKGENKKEWLAVHVVDFYNNLNLLIGPVEEHLEQSKESMKCGSWEYLFKDPDNSKYNKPCQLTAFDYINLTFDLIERRINDETLFPTDEKIKYPKNYKKVVKDTFKRMFRILAFFVIEKYRVFDKKGTMAHLNTIVKHFLCFTFEFDLLTRKELGPMKKWILENLSHYKDKLKDDE